MQPTATHIAYYHICHRKLWLFHHGIRMEHSSDVVFEGKLIGEESYPQRAAKYTEVLLGNVKIDFYDVANKIVHEIKKSDKLEEAHLAQVKYYLYVLYQSGVEDAVGIIEYPKLRKTTQVAVLDQEDIQEVQQWEKETKTVCNQSECPTQLPHKSLCKSCSYFEFCYG